MFSWWRNNKPRPLLEVVTIRIEFYNGNPIEMKKHINKVEKAYNSTHDMFIDEDGLFDLFESFNQLANSQEFFDAWVAAMSYRIIQTSHDRDLGRQVKAYKQNKRKQEVSGDP